MTSKSRQVSKRHRDSNHPLQRLLNYGHNYRQQIWQATAFSIINKLLDLAPPVLIGIAVDVVVKQQDSIISLLGVKDIFWQFLLLSLITVISNLAPGNMDVKTTTTCKVGKVFNIE